MRTAPIASRHPQRRILAFALAALLPLVLLAGFAVTTALSAFRAADTARLQHTARALAAAVDAELRASIAALRVLARSPVFDEDPDPALITARLASHGAELGGWIVALGPPPGHAVLAMSNQADPATLPAALPPETTLALQGPLTEVFARGRPTVSDLFRGNVIPRPIVTTMVPVERGGVVRYALALSQEPAALQAMLAQQELPDGTFAGIADGRFRLLAHSTDADGRLAGTSTPGWVASTIGDRQSALVIGRGLGGQDNIYAVERLRVAPGWTVAVGQPVALQSAAAWRAVHWLLAGGGALGIGIAIAVWASRREAVRDAQREAAALRAGRAEVERLHGGLRAVIFRRLLRRDGTSTLLYRGGDFAGVTGWADPALAATDDYRHLALPGDPTLADQAEPLWRDGEARYEWRLRQPDGGVRWISTLVRVLARPAADLLEVVGHTVDITAEREAKARALAATRLASLGEMAAGMAHELRQPLQSISMAAELAALAIERGAAPDTTERLGIIVEQAERAGDLIEHLRRFARGAEAGAPLADVSLPAVVDAALRLVGNLLHEAAVEVEVALGDAPPVVQGHAVLLEQVLTNLLLNARDALAALPRGTARRIRIATAPAAPGQVALEVADTAGGIPAAILARIPEPFVTTKDPDKGTGLGLAICHGLMQGMGGAVAVRNEASGAVFTLTLRAASGTPGG